MKALVPGGLAFLMAAYGLAADPELQTLVTEARRRIARLAPEAAPN